MGVRARLWSIAGTVILLAGGAAAQTAQQSAAHGH